MGVLLDTVKVTGMRELLCVHARMYMHVNGGSVLQGEGRLARTLVRTHTHTHILYSRMSVRLYASICVHTCMHLSPGTFQCAKGRRHARARHIARKLPL
jgi:hypothetical protein